MARRRIRAKLLNRIIWGRDKSAIIALVLLFSAIDRVIASSCRKPTTDERERFPILVYQLFFKMSLAK